MDRTEYLAHEGELTDWDQAIYRKLVSTEISPEERDALVNPPMIIGDEEAVLAIHWHPESVPMDINELRINKMFPAHSEELIIPTQHNLLMSFHEYSREPDNR